MSAAEACAILGLAAAASFIGTISGFGFALLIVPPLSFVVGPKEAVVLSNVLGASWLMTMFVRLHKHVDWRTAIPLGIAAFAGMPFGLLLLEAVSGRTLQIILGVNVLFATVVLWRGVRLPLEGRLVDAATGFLSGVLNTSTSMNGPPVVLHLQNRGLAPVPFRATLSAFFVSSSLLTLALYAVGGQLDGFALAAAAVGLPGLAVGYLAGDAVSRRLDAAQFRGIVVGVLILSATLILARSVFG